MLPLIVIAAFVWLVKNAVEDTSMAVRGKESQRRRYRHERWQARRKRTGQAMPVPGGFWAHGAMRRYLYDSWTDAWTDANTKRADRVADRREAYRLAREAKVAERREAAAAKPVVPTTKPLAAAVPQVPEQREPSPALTQPTAAAAEGDGTDSPTAAQPATGTTPADEQDPGPIPADATADDLAKAFAASTYDPNHITGHKEADMTTPGGEVTGQATALNYFTQMEAAAGNAVASLEQSLAAMQGGKVTGSAIQHGATAMDLLSQARAALGAAKQVLTSHTSVTEAYSASPDAGDKDWHTKE